MVRTPLQYAGCYSLDLYCDECGRGPGQYTGETFAECIAKARKQRWRIHRKTRTATCPRCSGKKP